MPNFTFTAIDATGRERTGSVEAPSVELASTQVKGMGLFPTAITSLDAAARAPGARVGRKRKTTGPAVAARKPIVIGAVIGAKGLTTFTRQLATLTQAGLPLLRSLEVLARQERNPGFKWVVEQLGENIRIGNTFSEGLSQHPKVFDRLYINMVKAGEAGGVLDVVLNRLARFMEKSQKIRGKVISAMVYPAVVLGITVLILTALLVFIVPKFQSIYRDMLKGAEMPFFTQIVLGISGAVKNNFLISVGLLVLFIFALAAVRRTRRGAYVVDWLAFNIPLLGSLGIKSAIARFTRTLGTLLSSGVPILQALLITRDTSGNAILRDAIDHVHDRVKEGEDISGPLESRRIFPAMVTSMIDVGEETGELFEMLNRIADTYEEEVDNAVAGLTSIIEPIMIVFLAGVVGSIVIALFLPIVQIIQNMNTR